MFGVPDVGCFSGTKRAPRRGAVGALVELAVLPSGQTSRFAGQWNLRKIKEADSATTSHVTQGSTDHFNAFHAVYRSRGFVFFLILNQLHLVSPVGQFEPSTLVAPFCRGSLDPWAPSRPRRRDPTIPLQTGSN